MADQTIIELLRKYILVLNAEGIPVHKAFLYGSYSDNSASDKSDIDIMVLSEAFDKENDELAGRAWMLTRKVSTQIEPFLIGLKRFENDDSSPLIAMVKEKGIEI
jgi:predicted nucleotidyltransferase